MANHIETTNIAVSQYVDVTSRYNNSKVIYYNGLHQKKVLTFNTYKRSQPQISVEDKFTIITAASQYRPDIVSNAQYGVPHFWWKIMEFNNIHDIMDFKIGLTIRLPASI
jgi:hypothetical protein